MDQGVLIKASELSLGDKLLALSSVIGDVDLYPLPSKKTAVKAIDKPRLQTMPSQFPETLFTAKSKKRKISKESYYCHYDKIAETVNKLRKLRAENPTLFDRVVGKSLESKGIIDAYDDYTHFYMDKVQMVLNSFVNGTFDSKETIVEVSLDLNVTIPAFSSLVDEFEFVRTSFEGIPKVIEASRYLTAYITRMLSQVVAVKSSFTVEFDLLLGRKVAMSECYTHLSAPFVCVSTNLKKIGLTKEIQVHGAVRSTCSPDHKISSLKIFFDPYRFSEMFGSADFNPL